MSNVGYLFELQAVRIMLKMDKECFLVGAGLAKVYGTRYSQAVTHPSTNRARRCLTSVIGREPVLST